jgi:hypothetical protein
MWSLLRSPRCAGCSGRLRRFDLELLTRDTVCCTVELKHAVQMEEPLSLYFAVSGAPMLVRRFDRSYLEVLLPEAAT